MDELLEQCQSLLKPIRDLEQNWSVDLANELTQAILSLNDQMVTFGQNGDRIIDFSKAAMIIQGSAHVYSKKVDYLYKKVYEMKEWLEKLWEVEKKSRGRNKSTGDGAANVDLDPDDEDDDLDLTGIKEQETRLDETKIADQIEGSVLLPPKPSNLAGSFNLKIPLKSISGDVIGYMNDFLINSIDVQALVYSQGSVDEHAAGIGRAPEMQQSAPADDPDTQECCTSDSPVAGSTSPPPEPELPPMVGGVQSDTPIRTDRQLRVPRPWTVQPTSPTPQQVAVDPWTQILDPHSTTLGRPSKDMCAGNCRVLPPSLRKGKKRKPGANQSVETKANDIATFCDKEYGLLGATAGSYLLFSPFKALFAEALKKRLAKLRTVFGTMRKPLQFGSEEACDDNLDVLEDDCNRWDGCVQDGGEDDNEEIPFSRLQGDGGEMEQPAKDSPVAYSEFLAQMIQKQYEDLSTQSDRLSEIDKRVKAWEKSVRGAIELTESRPVFDMLHYTEDIFNSFTEDENSILMCRLLDGKPKYEAFRTFVSTLILANHGNIEIVDDADQVRVSLVHRTTLSDVIAAEVTTGQEKVTKTRSAVTVGT